VEGVLLSELNLLGDFAVTRGFPWHAHMARLQSRCPRVPVDLTGMKARLEVFDTLHLRRAPWVFSTETGHIELGGGTGEFDIRLAAADTLGITATACRYRLIFTDALGEERILARGRLAVLEDVK
jgi:hypothetical protein